MLVDPVGCCAGSIYYILGTNSNHKNEETTDNIAYIRKMYFSHWKTPGVSERIWCVNLDASISGEYQTIGGHCWGPSE
jgi:hypothetical protein